MPAMRCREDALAAGLGRTRLNRSALKGARIFQILGDEYAGALLILYRGDPKLHRAGGFIPLHAPYGGASIGTCGHQLIALAGVEDAAGPWSGSRNVTDAWSTGWPALSVTMTVMPLAARVPVR